MARDGTISRAVGGAARHCGGFTLVELLVALVLTGLVLLVARAMLAEVGDAAARAQAAAREADRAGNRRLWLVRLFGSADVGSFPQRGFRGLHHVRVGREADEVEFQARVRIGEGLALRVVRLWLAADSRLLAELLRPPGAVDGVPDTLVLGESVTLLGLDYLLDYGASTPWVDDWVSPVSAPVAARLRVGRLDGTVDTLLLHVGTHG